MIDSPELVEAITSFSSGYDVVRTGARLAPDHPLVRQFPQHFVSAALPDQAKRRAAVQAVMPQTPGWAQKPPPPPPPAAPKLDGMECVSGPYTVTDYDAGTKGATRTLNAGDRLPVDHPLVREYPHIFRAIVEERAR